MQAPVQFSEETHYFTGKPCKHGHVSFRRLSDRVCMECDKGRKAKLRTKHPEKAKAAKRASYQRNAQHARDQKKQYRQNNKGKINALVTARKACVKQRTPSWLTPFDKLKIRCIYQLAAMYTRENDEPWHVDHIIPLQGGAVSGLHVPNNLRPMRGIDNISKKNKFEVVYG